MNSTKLRILRVTRLALCLAIGVVATAARAMADEEPAEKTRQQKVAEARAAEAKQAAEAAKPAAEDAKPADAKPKRTVLRVEGAVVDGRNVVLRQEVPDDALTQQWVQQYQPLLMTELNFIRQTCELAPEERPKIRAAGEASLRESIKAFAKLQQVNGGQVIVNGRVQNAQPQVQATIRKGLDKALREVLSPEQMAQYEEELAERTAQRRRAAILCVVSRLDAALFLSAEQRDRITTTFDEQWKDDWEQWLSLSAYDAMYVPQMPDSCVLPYLDESQKIVWRGMSKIQLGGIHRGVQVANDDGWWGNAPAKPAAGVQPPGNDILRPLKRLFRFGD